MKRVWPYAAGVVLSIVALYAARRRPDPPDPSPEPPEQRDPPAVSAVEPPAAPDWLPQETEFQREFARQRAALVGDPRRAMGPARRYFSGCAEEALPLLKEAARRDPDDLFRAVAVMTLGELKRADLGDELFVERLKEDPAWNVRHNAAMAIEMLGRKDDLPVLRSAAEKDPHERVREAAARAVRTLEAGE